MNNSIEKSTQQLIELLSNCPSGRVPDGIHKNVISVLQPIWNQLTFGDRHNTFANKLDRMENLAWNAPILSFQLERHGATVNGSSRAALHFWEIDLSTGRAKIVRESHRQLTPMSKRLDCTKLATEIHQKICDKTADDALVWEEDTKVTVRISTLIPETSQQTTTARRKRFRDSFIPLMEQSGWQLLAGNKLRFARK